MNQKEIFLSTLIQLTRAKEIEWAISNSYQLIEKANLNPDKISQVFHTYYNNSNIYMVEQKTWDYNLDFDKEYEAFHYFVNVTNGRDVIYSIYENEVTEKMLYNLLNLIHEIVENEFFNNFMKNIPQ